MGTFYCAGLLVFSSELQQAIMLAEDEAALDHVRPGWVRSEGGEEFWKYRLRVARARRGCTHDFTAQIEELPAGEHQITCPRCGNVAGVSKYEN